MECDCFLFQELANNKQELECTTCIVGRIYVNTCICVFYLVGLPLWLMDPFLCLAPATCLWGLPSSPRWKTNLPIVRNPIVLSAISWHVPGTGWLSIYTCIYISSNILHFEFFGVVNCQILTCTGPSRELQRQKRSNQQPQRRQKERQKLRLSRKGQHQRKKLR